MNKDDQVYVGHMLDTAERALNLAKGRTRTDYDNDERLRLSLTHLVQVIGEAAARVSNEYRTGVPAIPWREIVGMRHKIVHDYLNVDENIVWGVVANDLPQLVAELKKLDLPEPEA